MKMFCKHRKAVIRFAVKQSVCPELRFDHKIYNGIGL